MKLSRQVKAVSHRMFTDAEVQAVQPNIDLRVLRKRLEATGFDMARLRAEVFTSTYRIYDDAGVDEITWPDGTSARWSQKGRPKT